jgi:signal transduction histidine kinase
MQVRGVTLGVITVATSGSGRTFSAADQAVVEDVAGRAALALENGRLFREAQEQAEHQAFLNSALRSTIDERDRAMADLQQALRTRDEFLASASHDLKNPLASIKATAQLLQRRIDLRAPDQSRLREGLQRLDEIASRAAGQVEELLDLARMQIGQPLDLDRQTVDLLALLRGALAEQQLATDRHTLRLESDEAELVGYWDPRRLARVFTNLLDNAQKYSPSGSAIVLRVRREPATAVVEVRDQGVGIPAADVNRIFERFQRASNVEGRVGGTGIGLASARHFVESHGGTIEVESQERVGSLFRVRLPLDRAP